MGRVTPSDIVRTINTPKLNTSTKMFDEVKKVGSVLDTVLIKLEAIEKKLEILDSKVCTCEDTEPPTIEAVIPDTETEQPKDKRRGRHPKYEK